MLIMKKFFAFSLLLISSFGVMAQAQNQEGTTTIERDEITCIIQPKHLPIKVLIDVRYFFRAQIIQPTAVNELPNGTMPLSEDLPYVQTIRGAVYTFDHIRYTVRN